MLSGNHQAEGLEKPSGESPCVTANTADEMLLVPSMCWQLMWDALYLLLTSALYRDLWCCPASPSAVTRVWDPNPTFCKVYKMQQLISTARVRREHSLCQLCPASAEEGGQLN